MSELWLPGVHGVASQHILLSDYPFKSNLRSSYKPELISQLGHLKTPQCQWDHRVNKNIVKQIFKNCGQMS